MVKYSRIKKTGLIVMPYHNQFISGEIYGVKGEVEVSFSKDRFVTLMNFQLTDEIIREFKVNEKKEFEFVNPLKKEDRFLN